MARGLRLFLPCLLPAAVAASDEALGALHADDECAGDDEVCALNALQLRGTKQQEEDTSDATQVATAEQQAALAEYLGNWSSVLLENDGWGGCSAHHTSFFCSGSTGISCCHRNGVWKQCGSAGHHHNCMGGGGGHTSHHSCGPYGCSGGGSWHHHSGWLQTEEQQALNETLEFVKASLLENDGWGSCSTHHTSFFCAGSTGISCCHRNGVWKQCGSAQKSHNCMGGGSSATSHHQCGPYGCSGGGSVHHHSGWVQENAEEGEPEEPSARLASALESAKAALLENDGWGGCSAHHTSFFCAGSTGISCCHRNGVWKQCGSAGHHHNCRGGGGGHTSHHSCGPYGCSGGGSWGHHNGWGGHSGGHYGYHTGWLQENAEEGETEEQNALADTLDFVKASLLENDGWGSCSTHHTSFFCAGSTGISCCHRNGVWKQCGSAGHSHNCMGGGSSHTSHHQCGPYGCSGGGSYHHHSGWVQEMAEEVVTSQENTTGAACYGSQNKFWKSGNFGDNVYNCAIKNGADVNNGANCIQKLLHVTGSCAHCFGELMHCGIKCASECCGGTCRSSGKCKSCSRQKCDGAFKSCSGYWPPSR